MQWNKTEWSLHPDKLGVLLKSDSDQMHFKVVPFLPWMPGKLPVTFYTYCSLGFCNRSFCFVSFNICFVSFESHFYRAHGYVSFGVNTSHLLGRSPGCK